MMTKKLIYVASPYKGTRQDEIHNEEFAKKCCKFVLEHGHNVFASHLFYTQFLDDDNEAARLLGINLGMDMLSRCDELWSFVREGQERTIGMLREQQIAKGLLHRHYIVSDDGTFKLQWETR